MVRRREAWVSMSYEYLRPPGEKIYSGSTACLHPQAFASCVVDGTPCTIVIVPGLGGVDLATSSLGSLGLPWNLSLGERR